MNWNFTGSDATRETKSSQVEGDYESRESQLLSKLLMMSIQIDRKDEIIRQLLQMLEQGRTDQVQQLNSKCHSYEIEIRSLRETKHMLQESITEIENRKRTELPPSNHYLIAELQEEIKSLSVKHKKREEELIEVIEEHKNFRTKQSMSEYKINEALNNEKARVRTLEDQLVSEKAKVDIEKGKCEHQKRMLMEKANLIEDLKEKLHIMSNNQVYMRQQYEDEIVRMRSQNQMNDNLKRSQINNNEEKMALISQEFERLQEDNRSYRKTIEQLKSTTSKQDKELQSQLAEYKKLQVKLTTTENQYRSTVKELEDRLHQMRMKEKELLNERHLVERKLLAEIDEGKFMLNNCREEAQMFAEQASRHKLELNEYSHQLDEHRSEIRKLKRKPISGVTVCESCRVRQTQSTSFIASQHSVGGVDMSEIIAQTEQLIRSNIRVQNLINKQQTMLESSIQMYRTHAYNE